MAGTPWTRQEVDIIIADYFLMRAAELRGAEYSKTSHREDLAKQLPDRSEGAIEFKHCNISAILQARCLPFIDGYKPRVNVQGLLIDRVEAYLAANAPVLAAEQSAHLQQPLSPTLLEETKPPSRSEQPRTWHQPPPDLRYAPREREQIGLQGEERVFEFEREKVRSALGSAAAAKVVWVSRDEGDGFGYDIRSLDTTASSGPPAERYLEVKSTTQGKRFPFFLTANERRFAQAHTDRYQLRRVYDLQRRPRFFNLSAQQLADCHTEAIAFRVTP